MSKKKTSNEQHEQPETVKSAAETGVADQTGTPKTTETAKETVKATETVETTETTKTAEDVETQPETASAEKQLENLQKELAEAKQAKDEMYNRMLRVQADFENFRRRSRQEIEQLGQYAGEDLLKKILPVLDSLERAVQAFGDSNVQAAGWQEGVKLTLRQFHAILQAEGLTAVEALNQPFDPQVHEAVLQEESSEVTEPTVIQELQRGYKYKDKLLRPSLVKVAVPAG